MEMSTSGIGAAVENCFVGKKTIFGRFRGLRRDAGLLLLLLRDEIDLKFCVSTQK